jgi:NTP pyrophosphatase (non-canonical NTP hydrolase)
LDIRDLTEEMQRFVTAKGWYKEESLRPQTPRNLAISLSLESAEVLEHFQWSDEIKDSKEFRGELADVALYLLQLASVTGVDLEQAILEKLEKNYGREWDQKTSPNEEVK